MESMNKGIALYRHLTKVKQEAMTAASSTNLFSSQKYINVTEGFKM